MLRSLFEQRIGLTFIINLLTMLIIASKHNLKELMCAPGHTFMFNDTP